MTSRKTNLVIVSALVVMLSLSAVLKDLLGEVRNAVGLNPNPSTKGVPPVLVVTTTMLGCFRGILIDHLWIRAAKLKEEGRFYEHVQISDWICKLEPRFPGVWAYRAWDLAYNISVEMPTAPARWRWVNEGVRLLRDEGLTYNPDTAALYWELGWIFFHKIGGISDRMHWYYKERLFSELDEVLALGGRDIGFIARADTVVRELLQRKNRSLEEICGKDGSVNIPPELADELRKEHPEHSPEEWVRAAYAAELLKEKWKMDPVRMAEITDRYGPVDWRIPWAHSLYWACEGRRRTSPDDTIKYDRLIYFSLQEMLRRGKARMVKRGEDRVMVFLPDYRFLPAVESAFRRYLDYYRGATYETTIRDAYENFLKRSIVTAYFAGRKRQTIELYKKLFPRRRNVTLEEIHDFVQKRLREDILDQKRSNVLRTLEVMIGRMWFAFASGDEDNAALMERQVKAIIAAYNKQNIPGDELRRLGLPPYEQFKNDVLQRIIDGRFKAVPFPDILVRRLKEKTGMQPGRAGGGR